MDIDRIIEEDGVVDFAEAKKCVEEVGVERCRPVLLSYYALSLASSEGEFDEARDLCVRALKRDLDNPQIYYNLGRIFLLAEDKELAFDAFSKGLKKDKCHVGIRRELASLGIRRNRVINFLSRRNPFNMLLGKVTYKLGA